MKIIAFIFGFVFGGLPFLLAEFLLGPIEMEPTYVGENIAIGCWALAGAAVVLLAVKIVKLAKTRRSLNYDTNSFLWFGVLMSCAVVCVLEGFLFRAVALN